MTLAEWAVSYIRIIIQYVLSWFSNVMGVMGLQWLWLGAVVFTIVFSVILLPMRGGSMLGGGMASDIARSKVRAHRGTRTKNHSISAKNKS